MYTIVSTIGQMSEPSSRWETIDTAGQSLLSLLSNYTDVYLRLSNPFWDEEKTTKLSMIRSFFTDTTITLEQFFTGFGNTAIPTLAGHASITQGKVTFCDAVLANYKLSRAVWGMHPEHIPDITTADTVVMRKTGVDARHFHRNCLVTVNGLIHRVDADSTYIYVKDAAVTSRYCGRNEVGVLSFSTIGEIECVSIDPEQVTRLHPDQPMKNQVCITTDTAADGRVCALVMGGYLFLLDSTSFYQISDKSYVLESQSIALISRFFESKKVMPMDFLGIEYAGEHDAQISADQLLSDEVMKKWLTCSQSFLVFIDTDNISVDKEQIRDSRTYGHYILDKEPVEPVVFGSGIMPSYWKQYDEGKWLASTANNYQPNYLMHTTPAAMRPMPADNELPYNPHSYHRAYLLHITTQKVVIE